MVSDDLQQRGHPLAPLLVFAASGQTEAARRYRFEQRSALLGALPEQELPWRIVWKHGFPRVVELVVRYHSERAVDALEHLAQLDALFMVERLRLVGTANFDPLVRWLLARDWPRLRTLHLGPLALGAGVTHEDLSRLEARAPVLEELKLPVVPSLHLEHPNLRRLMGSPLSFRATDVARLPRLERLDLHFRERFPADQVRQLAHIAVSVQGPDTHRYRHPILMTIPHSTPERDPLLVGADQLAWRRFERNGRFWRIRRDAADLELSWGKLGADGTTKRVPHGGMYIAAQRYRDRIIAKRKQGWTEVYEPPGAD